MTESNDETDYEDVDDIIGIAERLKQKNQESLSDEELQEVGAELGIPAEYIDQARDELERRRREERTREERLEKRRRRWRRRGLIAGGALLVVFGLWSWIATAKLNQSYSAVESHRSEVRNQLDRKAAIREQFADQPDSPEKQAQLTGSENRVRVAIQRYNDVAADYNRRARSFPASLWKSIVGLPDEVPGGDEIASED